MDPSRKYAAFPELKAPFECPLCGNEAFDQVEVFDARGNVRKTQAFQCRGCTVMFKDRNKFTRHRRMALSEDQLYRLATGRTHD